MLLVNGVSYNEFMKRRYTPSKEEISLLQEQIKDIAREVFLQSLNKTTAKNYVKACGESIEQGLIKNVEELEKKIKCNGSRNFYCALFKLGIIFADLESKQIIQKDPFLSTNVLRDIIFGVFDQMK
jgi:hypothetical protein